MVVKEEIFIICDEDIKTPYFSSDPRTDLLNADDALIITDNVLEDCVSWLEERGIKNTTLYLGIWFDVQMNWNGLDSKIMLRMANIDTHLCISVY
jgi:hypothetical protein